MQAPVDHSIAPIDRALSAAPIDRALSAPPAGSIADVSSLAALEMRMTHASELFAVVVAQAHQEQGWYWARFSALTAVHAGLFAFSSVQERSPGLRILLTAGMLFSGFWIWIQWLSLGYVNRSKERQHAYERNLGLRPMERQRWRPASTDVGFLMTVGVGIAWVLLVIGVW